MKPFVTDLAALILLVGALHGGEVEKLKATQVINTGRENSVTKPAVITGLAMQPGGKLFASAGDDHHVRLWRTSDGRPLETLLGHRDWVRAVVFSPDGTMLASAGDDRRIMLWDVAAAKPLRTIEVGRSIYSLDWSHTGDMIVAAGFDCKVRIYNASSGKLITELDGPCGDLRSVTFSADSSRVAAAGRNAQVRAWLVKTGSMSFELAAGVERIRALAYSPDGDHLVASGDGRTVDVWDAARGLKVSSLTCRSAKVLTVSFCGPNLLATGGSDNLIRVWDTRSSTELYQLTGHTGTVAALACDVGTRTIVSGSYDTTIRIWKLAEDDEKVAQPLRDEAPLR